MCNLTLQPWSRAWTTVQAVAPRQRRTGPECRQESRPGSASSRRLFHLKYPPGLFKFVRPLLQSARLSFFSGDLHMQKAIRFAAAGLLALVVPLAAQQDVPMRGTTPVAPQGIKIPPLPDTPVRFETGEGQTIRVSVYARGFCNPWSMAFVSDDTMLVAERGGAIRVVRKGVVEAQPALGAPVATGAGLSGTDIALHPDFERNHVVYISYTKPLGAQPGGAAPGGNAGGGQPCGAAAGGRGAGTQAAGAGAGAQAGGAGAAAGRGAGAQPAADAAAGRGAAAPAGGA